MVAVAILLSARTRLLRLRGRETGFRELDVFVGPNYVVTAHPEDEPVVEEAWRRAGWL